jgi:hypothetical protein
MDALLNAFFGQVLRWLRLPGKNPVLCYAFEMEKITFNLGDRFGVETNWVGRAINYRLKRGENSAAVAPTTKSFHY